MGIKVKYSKRVQMIEGLDVWESNLVAKIAAVSTGERIDKVNEEVEKVLNKYFVYTPTFTITKAMRKLNVHLIYWCSKTALRELSIDIG